MPSPSFLTLGAELASEQDRVLAAQSIREPDLLREGRDSLYVLSKRRKFKALTFFIFGLSVAVTTALAVLWLAFPVVDYALDGEALLGTRHPRLGQWVASANEPSTLRFSDGSVAKSSPETRLRVVETGRRGASLLLESGSIELWVAGSYMTDYLLGAGPFTVEIPKGRVKVSFDATNDTLDLVVDEGNAMLSGCQFRSGVSVAAQSKAGGRCRD